MRVFLMVVWVGLSGVVVGQGVEGVKDTRFSVRRGFFDEAFLLEITTGTEGATVVYTTDGSAPAEGVGTVYTGPVEIGTTTVVRAMAFKEGLEPTNVDTQTYLFLDDVIEQPAEVDGYPNPMIWLGGSRNNEARHDYEMDPAVVNASRDDLLAGLRAIPSMSLAVDPGEMWGSGGFYEGERERVGSVEVLYPDDPEGSEQAEAGVEPHSHNRMKRSLRLNFRAEFGDGKWRTDLFRRMPFNDPGVTDTFDRVILRGGNNRCWARVWSEDKATYVEDEFQRQTQLAMSGDGKHGAFVHLYINGLYWGLYNPVERADRFHTSEYYGGEADDWFAVSHGGDLSGNDDRWDYLKGDLKNKNMAVARNYAELQAYLDIDNFIDYLLVHWYTATGDWPNNNWYGGNRNAGDELGPTPMKFFAWDGEWSWDLPHSGAPNPAPYDPWVHKDFHENRTKNQGRDIAKIFNSAKDSGAFLRRLADRAYRHLENGGALTDAACRARYAALAGFIEDAVVGESARWGDTLEGQREPTYTRDEHWRDEVAVHDGLMVGRAAKFFEALREEGYYPDVQPPIFEQHGGEVPVGFRLEMTNANGGGTVFYTTDGGEPDGDGVVYTGPVEITEGVRVKARVRQGGEWSALAEAVFFTPAVPSLRVTEVMYHPADPSEAEAAAGFTNDDDFEFIEVKNVGDAVLELAGLGFGDGVSMTFGEGSLAPGEVAVVVGNAGAFAERYGGGVRVLGEYSGRLKNGGESVALVTALGQDVVRFFYEDGWDERTDGGGFSLQAVDPGGDLDLNLAGAWAAGAVPGGTPGREGIDYALWAERWGRGAATDDDNGDGVANLVDYGLVSGVVEDGVARYAVDVRKGDVEVVVETATNLEDWEELAGERVGVEGFVETWRVGVPEGGGTRFVRWRVGVN